MSTRKLILAIVCFSFPATLTAQQPNDADGKKIDPADRKWIEERVEFIRDAYGLNDGQARAFSESLMGLWEDQRQYQFETNVTLRGIKAAMRDVTGSNLVAPPSRPAFLAMFERQMYDFVYLKAPLSFANVLKNAEAGLSPEQIAAGRDKLKKSFKAPAEFSKDTVDWDLRKPVEIPSMALKQPAALPAFPPMDESNPSLVSTKTDTPPTTRQPIPTKTVTPPVDPGPPKVIEPAPPLEQWAGLIGQTIAKYKFNPEQNTKAQAILSHCRDRAAAHKQENEEAYQQAAAIADADERSARLKKLNLKLDTLYDQLAERVDSLATLEQKQAASKADKDGGA